MLTGYIDFIGNVGIKHWSHSNGKPQEIAILTAANSTQVPIAASHLSITASLLELPNF